MIASYNKELHTPAYARKIALWAIKSAAENPIGSDYGLITARVFTAFMFEGVIDHLGETLRSTWNDKRGERRSIAYESVVERHKAVRGFLKLDNSGHKYQEIQSIIRPIIKFRDGFAHPRTVRETVEGWECSPGLAEIPAIAWESEIDAKKVDCDYRQVEKYCQDLLDATAGLLETEFKSGRWSLVLEKYPHLEDFHSTVRELKGYLLCTAIGAWG